MTFPNWWDYKLTASTISKRGTPWSKKFFELKGPECYYCTTVLEERTYTVDHVIPQALGGTHDWENLVVCCRSCNSSKGKIDLKQPYNFQKVKSHR